MKIRETEEGYIVEFFPEAKVVGRREEPEKEWWVEVGYLEKEDVFVPARAFYGRGYSLNEVRKYAERGEKCLRRALGLRDEGQRD